jgi:diacylglycerol kinase (ATP)
MIAWLGRLGRSFRCAFAGLVCVMRTQRNARIHLLAVAAVIATGAWLGISATEWCMVTLSCGMVIAAEALNTAVENLADRITTKTDERIRTAKDVAAGGVLVTAIAALIVGFIVFLPRLIGKL